MSKNNEELKELLPDTENILMNEDAILAGMLEASNFKSDKSQYRKIQIKRNGGPVLFEFKVRPLSEEEIQDCRKQSTTMIPNPAGRHLPKVEGKTDYVRLRSIKIYLATIDEEKEKVWNNPVIKNKLNVFTPEQVIDTVLLAGEKDWICDIIDEISGYGTQEVSGEEYAKN